MGNCEKLGLLFHTTILLFAPAWVEDIRNWHYGVLSNCQIAFSLALLNGASCPTFPSFAEIARAMKQIDPCSVVETPTYRLVVIMKFNEIITVFVYLCRLRNEYIVARSQEQAEQIEVRVSSDFSRFFR